jgi:hypothetical protein
MSFINFTKSEFFFSLDEEENRKIKGKIKVNKKKLKNNFYYKKAQNKLISFLL